VSVCRILDAVTEAVGPESEGVTGLAMQPLSIRAFASYLPENEVGLEFFYGGSASAEMPNEAPMFKAPASRRHIARDERAATMIEKASRTLFDRLGIDPDGNVDILITNVLLPDFGITGSGAEAAALLDCSPEWIIDLHNGGCASFVYMLKLARSIIDSGAARSALLCNVQNCAGQVFSQSEVRKSPHAAIPGDGCGVAYVIAGEGSPVIALETRNFPRHATDMGLAAADGRKYWEPGSSQVDVRFNEARAVEILQHGNRVVPTMVSELCEKIDISPGDIDVLVTNQPNRLFLRNWREALGLDQRKHLDTFDRFGNLFGAGMPITLDHAVREGQIHDDDLVVVAGFAHAGDFAAAAAIRWHGEAP
jgi:3-oxoacyl-[acyl-carrier-protein] synthase-3